jgi:hypothetical protein
MGVMAAAVPGFLAAPDVTGSLPLAAVLRLRLHVGKAGVLPVDRDALVLALTDHPLACALADAAATEEAVAPRLDDARLEWMAHR